MATFVNEDPLYISAHARVYLSKPRDLPMLQGLSLIMPVLAAIFF